MELRLFPNKYIPGVDGQTARSLRFSVLDGCLWAIMFGFGESFIVPFANHLQASTFLISLITAGMNIAFFFGSLASIWLLKAYPHRKSTAIITNVLHGITYIFLFWTTYHTSNPLFILVFYVMGIFITTTAISSWFTWMNDLVPENIRGIFWGGRNQYLTICQIVATLAGGYILSHFTERKETILGFGILFMLASLFRIASAFALRGQHHVPMTPLKHEEHYGLFAFIRSLWKTNLGRFILFNILFTFSTNIMPALISVHLLRSIEVSFFQFAVINSIFSLSYALFMPYWGRMADRFGNKRVFVFTTSLIPIVAIGWALARDFPVFVVIQVISGFLWSGSTIASQNFIIDNSNPRTLALNHPYNQALNNLSAFAGGLVGGLLSILVLQIPSDIFRNIPVTGLRLELIFILSALLRLVVVGVLIRGIKEVKEKPVPTRGEVHVFVLQPALELANSVFPLALMTKHVKRGFRELGHIIGKIGRKP